MNRALFLSLKRIAIVLIWSSSNKHSLIRPGKSFKPSIIDFSLFLLIVSLITPIEHVSKARATSWVVKALVLATPISVPA